MVFNILLLQIMHDTSILQVVLKINFKMLVNHSNIRRLDYRCIIVCLQLSYLLADNKNIIVC